MERRNFLKILLAGCVAPAIIPTGNLMKLNTNIIKASDVDVKKYASSPFGVSLEEAHADIFGRKLFHVGDMIEKDNWVGVITEIRTSEQVVANCVNNDMPNDDWGNYDIGVKPVHAIQERRRVINNPERTYKRLGSLTQ